MPGWTLAGGKKQGWQLGVEGWQLGVEGWQLGVEG